MKKILLLLLCLLMLCGCNAIPFITSDYTKTSSITLTSNTISTTQSQSTPSNFSTKIYAAKNTTAYSDDMLFPKTVYTSIDKETYFYYSKLPQKLKTIYKKLCSSIECMADGFIDLGYISDDEISLLISSIKYDRPEYFWLGHDYVTNTKKDGYKQLAFKFNSDDYNINYLYTPESRNKILAGIKGIISDLENKVQNKLEYDRELYIHNFVVNRCSYDDSAVNNSDKKPNAYNIYGALALKSAVCEGYARAIQLLNNHFGIYTTVVIGSSDGQNHMWNMVKIEGDYYHLDATFNDSSNSKLYAYFNLSDYSIERTHKIDNKFYNNSANKIQLPTASTLAKSYFVVNDTLIDSDPYTSIYEAVEYAISHGKTSVNIGYSDSAVKYYKNNDELLADDINIMKMIYDINKRHKADAKNVSLTFAANCNFIVSWKFVE